MQSEAYLRDLEHCVIDRVIAKKNVRKTRKFAQLEVGRVAARYSFPNNLGGYPGKRPTVPAVAPLSATERFRQLVAFIWSKARVYKVQLTRREEAERKPKRFWDFDGRDVYDTRRIQAPTKSEARSAIKMIMRLKTTRGIAVYAA